MSSSSCSVSAPVGLHVAIIMDGNGRWAQARGLPRTAGHQMGAKTVRRIVEAAPTLQVGVLTLYAFSADNWRRPADEVEALMKLLERYLMTECQRCLDNDIRLCVIGRRDRLQPHLVRTIERVEAATQAGQRLWLRLAVDYSSRQNLLAAAQQLAQQTASGPDWETAFEQARLRALHSPPVGDVDLLIRTGGEQRLSDFMLWEATYAELMFTARAWPEFSVDDFSRAVKDFHRRERRFGMVTA